MNSRRILVSLRMLATEFMRRRVTLVLMFLLPTISFVSVYTGLPDTQIPVDVLENHVSAQITVGQRDIVGSFIVITYAAFLGGLSGLFLMQTGRATDRRLILCGYRASEITVARSLMLTVICAGLSLYLTAMLVVFLAPRHLEAYLLSVFLVALIYGGLGAITGTLIAQELGGILAMFFIPSLDVGWLQMPGYSEALNSWWIRLLPGYFPSAMSVDAAFTPTLETLGETWPSLGYAAALWLVATVAFARVTHVHRFTEPPRRSSRGLVALVAVGVVVAVIAVVAGVVYLGQRPQAVEADGRVAAPESQVTSLYDGRVAELPVAKGQHVLRGEVVARIEEFGTGETWPVYAPMTGTVTTVNVKENENVVAGTVLAVIYDLERPEVRLEVEEAFIPQVKVGQPVSLRFGPLNRDIPGRVKEISPVPLPPEVGVSEQRRRIRKYAVTVEMLESVPNISLEMGVRGKVFVNQ